MLKLMSKIGTDETSKDGAQVEKKLDSFMDFLEHLSPKDTMAKPSSKFFFEGQFL